jgi:NAD(P)-dependent dehydrogenase (short-subunit alcohol dehydrogenase family)
VTVNVVAPGYTRSEMLISFPEKTKEAILVQIPLGRVWEPEEVARAVR